MFLSFLLLVFTSLNTLIHASNSSNTTGSLLNCSFCHQKVDTKCDLYCMYLSNQRSSQSTNDCLSQCTNDSMLIYCEDCLFPKKLSQEKAQQMQTKAIISKSQTSQSNHSNSNLQNMHDEITIQILSQVQHNTTNDTLQSAMSHLTNNSGEMRAFWIGLGLCVAFVVIVLLIMIFVTGPIHM